MKKVNLVFGTVYGNAQFVAESLTDDLNALGYDAELKAHSSLSGYVPAEHELLIIVTSTTGQGDLPDDIQPWFHELKSIAPYLPSLKYGIVGLGDSSYDTFCGAAKQFDDLMSELGAKAVIERIDIDACETMEPEVEAKAWLQRWHTLVGSESAA